jgi:catechol 2,3-dioxygenase-like lactoylglutathione lyase family enzyme
MKISHLDHLVLTVSNIETTCHFYQTVLGFEVIIFKGNSTSEMGVSEIKHKSADPGVGCNAFGSNSLPCWCKNHLSFLSNRIRI